MLEEIELFMLDMDGTFYLGQELIPGAKKFFEKLKQQNREYVFLTNNSSRGAIDYQNKLSGMGIEVPLKRIVTSGEVTADYIKKKNKNASVYVVGTDSLIKNFVDSGLRVENTKNKDIDFLVLGFDTTLTYNKLWDAHDLILYNNVDYVATNPDFVCPLPEGRSMPDCGSFINLLKSSTGEEPIVIGKPNTLMVEYIADRYGIKKEQIAMIGDRLYTDIEMARKSGIQGILVLSGETDKKMLATSDKKPDFVFESVGEIAGRI